MRETRKIWACACVALAAVLWPSVVGAQPSGTGGGGRAATQPSEPADFSSPRGTMKTFLEAMREVRNDNRRAWGRVFRCMDLSTTSLETPETPPETTPESPGAPSVWGGEEKKEAVEVATTRPRWARSDVQERREVAKKLLALIDRRGEVDLNELPDAAEVERFGLKSYRFFPRHPEDDWIWQETDVRPKGSIVLVRNGDGRWVFSAQTMADLDTLYESTITLKERTVGGGLGDMVNVVGATWKRTRWVEWLGLLGAVFVGVAAGKGVQSGLNWLGARMEKRKGHNRATVFRNAASPLSLAILACAISLGLQIIYLEKTVREVSGRFIVFLYIVALGWFLYNLVELVEQWLVRIAKRTTNRLDNMLVPLIRKTLRVFLVIVFALLAAQNVLGLDITGWLAGLGIVGLAVSLGAQDTIKNLFGSLTVFFDKPFSVGETIIFEGAEGVVEEIGFRSTRVRTAAGNLVTIPNMQFTDRKVENSDRRPFTRRQQDIALPYDTPAEKVEEAVGILREILSEPEMAEGFDVKRYPPRVFFQEYGASSLIIRVIYWYMMGREGRSTWTYQEQAEKFNLKVLAAFAKAGIRFAFLAAPAAVGAGVGTQGKK